MIILRLILSPAVFLLMFVVSIAFSLCIAGAYIFGMFYIFEGISEIIKDEKELQHKEQVESIMKAIKDNENRVLQ